MTNVKNLPFNAATPAQLLQQIGRDMGDDLQACVVVFKQKSTGQMIVAVGTEEGMDQLGFMATAQLLLTNFAQQGIGGFATTPPKGSQ